ncbi:MFS transporter [Frigidibacter sp. RF13]|uniref:MFS transporter n=1 Tax=Frigidibacter sp. RF13 TaxID=2997340 RepID=UPI0022708DE7|nr:MFS transporter [Frigidibacter sp. RF13]MCY1125616.1 MFS transporter [Frigidibacter sp. RF13]
MTDMSLPQSDDRRARRNVMVLVAAQAIMGSQMPMIFIVGGLAGQMLATNPCWATLPISMIVLGSMLSANPLSALMAHYGRAAGFVAGALFGALGAGVAAFALIKGSFPLFLAGSLLTGTYMSAQGFYRFAAADTASPEFRPKAISYVMAGGLASALVGPELAKHTNDALAVTFLGTYLAVVALNLLGSLLFLGLDIPRPARSAEGASPGRTRRELLRDPTIVVAMICAMVAYALMNLVMTSTPLAVVGCGYSTGNAADIVRAHVLAMFAPAFFTGHLIARFGAPVIIGTGLAILAGAGAVALTGVQIEQFYLALILLGLGWNFGFIGATTLLSSAHRPEEKGRIQGINDFVVFGGVTAASLSSGVLMNCSGTNVVAGWNAVNIAMLPFLVLAGASLIWLLLRPAAR